MNGTIVDRHSAELQVIGLATTPGYEVLVQATGLGVLTDGSGKYNRDGGSSILALTMEVDADGQGKTRITIRLDDDVLEWFREQADAAGGASYQTLINQALREYVVERAEPLEEKIRRMVREEVAKYGEG